MKNIPKSTFYRAKTPLGNPFMDICQQHAQVTPAQYPGHFSHDLHPKPFKKAQQQKPFSANKTTAKQPAYTKTTDTRNKKRKPRTAQKRGCSLGTSSYTSNHLTAALTLSRRSSSPSRRSRRSMLAPSLFATSGFS